MSSLDSLSLVDWALNIRLFTYLLTHVLTYLKSQANSLAALIQASYDAVSTGEGSGLHVIS